MNDPTPADTLSIRRLHKRFDGDQVLAGVDLTIPTGSKVALLGPSGGGKTTLLRTIAGLERPDAGEIRLGDTVLSGGSIHVPPEHRRIGMVFQDWALFPHLDVAANVGYGLDRAGRASGRVEETLAMVGLQGFGHRAPTTLSGGQQQRVAIARAIAPRPAVILLDEPFSNLDASLRGAVRSETHRLLTEIGMTTLFVTHDQEEAFVFGDEVAVMSDGRIRQQGPASALDARPHDLWVASFVGEANLLSAVGAGDVTSSVLGDLPLDQPAEGLCTILVRPEQLRLDPGIAAEVVGREFYGHDTTYRVRLGDVDLVVRAVGVPRFGVGDVVDVTFVGDAVVAFPTQVPAPLPT